MEHLSPLKTRLISLYGPCESSGPKPPMYLSPCRWEPTGWKYTKHDVSPLRKHDGEKMETVTTNATFYVNHSKTSSISKRQEIAHTKLRKKVRDRFPPIPVDISTKTADFTLNRTSPKRPQSSNLRDFTDTLAYWAGRSVSPAANAYNRKSNFTTRWEDQVLSKGTIRRF